LLIGLGGIFDFVQLKKIKKAAGACKVPASMLAAPSTLEGACGWLRWFYWHFCCIIRFVSTYSSFLDDACIMVWCSLAGNGFFLFIFSLLFLPGFVCKPGRKTNHPFNWFFFLFWLSLSYLICNFLLFTLVISNWILISFEFYVGFNPNYFNCFFFCFAWFFFLLISSFDVKFRFEFFFQISSLFGVFLSDSKLIFLLLFFCKFFY
jgi:hypothetical protein